MTGAAVGALVAVVVILWGAARPMPRVPGLPPPPGERAATAFLAGASTRAGPGWPSGRRHGPRWPSRRRRRRAEHVEAQALELLDGLAPALRAGLPPVAALRLIRSTRRRASSEPSEWTELDTAAGRGDPLAPAWSACAVAVDSDDLRLVAAGWSLCETLGSPLAPTVATVAEVVRRRRAVRHRITAALAGPQATMRVLTALPLSGPVVAVVVGVAPSELYSGAAGVLSVVVGLGLLALGRLWASRMVRAVTAEPGAPRARRQRGDSRGDR